MTPTSILHLEGLAFLYALAVTVAFQILTGRISVCGLLRHENESEQVSAGRVQLLLATIFACASYLGQVAKASDGRMPDVDMNWLYVFGGSGSIYALEKAWTGWIRTKGN